MSKSGSKGSSQEEREQFDQFDRMQTTSGQKLDQKFTELAAHDNEGDGTDLLATTDRKSSGSEELKGASEKTQQAELENHSAVKHDDTVTIAEISSDKTLTNHSSYAAGELPTSTEVTPLNVEQNITPATVDFNDNIPKIQISEFRLPEVEVTPQEPEPVIRPHLETQQIATIHKEDDYVPEPATPQVPAEPTPPVPTPPVTADPEPSPTPVPDPVTPVPTPDPPPPTPDPEPEPTSVLLPNGNYSIPGNANVTITFNPVSSDSGYNNSFGHYFADSNGNIISGVIDFPDVKDSGAGTSITFTYTPYNIPPNAAQIGFFLIPNGAHNENLTYGSVVTFSHDAGGWAAYLNGQKLTGTGSDAFFSDQTLNGDNLDHIQEIAGNSTQLNIEDTAGGSSFGNVINVQVDTHAFQNIETYGPGITDYQSWLDALNSDPASNNTTFTTSDNPDISGDYNNYMGDPYDQNHHGNNNHG